LLGFEESREALCQYRYGSDLIPILHRLLKLDDGDVMQVLALVMAETLAIGSEAVEYCGQHLGVDMADCWQADDAFFTLLRDKEVMVALLGEVGGEAVASANATEKGATLKGLISDYLTGANERPKVERWVPRWMGFPPAAYTSRGGVPSVAAAKRAAWLVEGEEDEAQGAGAASDDQQETPEAEPLAA
jgi:ParB family chromosome partitioning protein